MRLAGWCVRLGCSDCWLGGTVWPVQPRLDRGPINYTTELHSTDSRSAGPTAGRAVGRRDGISRHLAAFLLSARASVPNICR